MFATQHGLRRVSLLTAALFSLLGLWAFVGAIDGPVVKLEPKSGHLLYQTPRVGNGDNAGSPTPLWNGIVHKDPPPLYPSIHLFDFKQDLRRWPIVARRGISHSPPFLPAA